MKIIQQLNSIAMDKWEHYSVTLTLAHLLRTILPRWIAGLVVLGISVGKELYDKFTHKGTPEWKDLMADVLGIIVGMI